MEVSGAELSLLGGGRPVDRLEIAIDQAALVEIVEHVQLIHYELWLESQINVLGLPGGKDAPAAEFFLLRCNCLKSKGACYSRIG